METHERFVIGIEQRSFVRHAIDRIRPIENDNLYARFLTGAHAEIHRPDKSIVARPDVLEIYEQNVDLFQHVRSRLAMFAVQTVNRNAQTGMLVTFPFHHVVLRLAEEPVLRTK